MVAALSSTGSVREWMKYSAYGVPYRVDPADYNRDGFVSADDYDAFNDDYTNSDAAADVNFDGFVSGDDFDVFDAAFNDPHSGGRGIFSAIGLRHAYAGYQYDPAFEGAGRSVYHVRHRVYDAGLGRWTRRDPIEYGDGANMYSAFGSDSISHIDGSGLRCGRLEPRLLNGHEPADFYMSKVYYRDPTGVASASAAIFGTAYHAKLDVWFSNGYTSNGQGIYFRVGTTVAIKCDGYDDHSIAPTAMPPSPPLIGGLTKSGTVDGEYVTLTMEIQISHRVERLFSPDGSVADRYLTVEAAQSSSLTVAPKPPLWEIDFPVWPNVRIKRKFGGHNGWSASSGPMSTTTTWDCICVGD